MADIAAPMQDDEVVEMRRFVRGLNAVIFAGIVIGLIGALANPVNVLPRMAVFAVSVLTLIASQWQVGPSPRNAVIALVTGFWFLTASNAILFAGVHSSANVIFPFVVALSGWLLGNRWLFAMTAASTVFVVVIAILEWLTWFVPTPRPPVQAVATTLIAVIPVIGYLTYAARNALLERKNRAVELSGDLQRFMENMPAAVAWFNNKSRLRRCNQRYADLYGKRASEIVGVNLVDYVPELTQQLVRDAGRKVLQGEPQSYRRFHVHPVTAAVTWLDVGITPEIAHGKVVGLYTVLVDVTENVKAEADIRILNDDLEARVKRRTDELASAMETIRESHDELVRSQAKAGLSAMVASVSHELATPVGNSVLVASTFRELALQLGRQMETGQLRKSSLVELQKTLEEGSDMLQRNLERAELLLRNFKQVSADQASEQRRHFDLAEVVAEVVASMIPALRKAPHQVQLELPAGIQMDSLPGPLGQVIINLINNAYTHGFDTEKPGVVTLRAKEEGCDVVLQIEDDGKGMAPEILQRLFEPFFSTRIGDGGTGLGMSIVRDIVVKSLGGLIEVQSAPGQGTRYVVTLPRSAPQFGD